MQYPRPLIAPLVLALTAVALLAAGCGGGGGPPAGAGPRAPPKATTPSGGAPSRPAGGGAGGRSGPGRGGGAALHGVHDFPDPTFSGGRISMRIKGGPGSDLDPNSPTFQAAQKACQSDLPGKLSGGPSTGK